MSLRVDRFECRNDDCDARFLTVDARNGHEQVHAEDFRRDKVIGVSTP